MRAPATRKPTPAASRRKVTARPKPAQKPAAPAKTERSASANPTKPMTLAQLRGFLEALQKAMPSPRSELDHTDPFTLLVAVVLSAQATDVGVNRATRTLFAEAPDAARGRGRAARARAEGAAAQCASLADPARPLRVQGAPAGVLALRRRAVVQLSRQDAGPAHKAAASEGVGDRAAGGQTVRST